MQHRLGEMFESDFAENVLLVLVIFLDLKLGVIILIGLAVTQLFCPSEVNVTSRANFFLFLL